MIEEFTPLTINEFNGDFDRSIFGVNDDHTPPGHFRASLNVDFNHYGVSTRPFFNKIATTFAHSDCRHVFQYTDSSGSFKYILSATDTTATCSLYIKNGEFAVYSALVANWNGQFTAVQIGNLIYFSPDQANASIYVFDPNVNVAARLAGGLRPVGTIVAANGAAGNVEIGLHLIAVAYETSTGFITKPNVNPTQYTAPGNLQINLSSIPIGPAGTVARHILVTKAIANYSGNINDYEFFKIAKINDNVTTVFTINFFDSDLSDSADSLFDLLETLPVCRKLLRYGNRLVIVVPWQTTIDENIIRISNPGEYEAFEAIASIITLNPSVPRGFQDALELNDLLYIMTAQGVISTRDNGDLPNTWEINLVDSAYRYPFKQGIGRKKIAATIYNHSTALENAGILVSESGLFIFRGGLQDELSWKIADIWPFIVNGIENIIIDTTARQIYILVNDPFFGRTVIRVCDFKNGLSKENARWTTWDFLPFTLPSSAITDILINRNNAVDIPKLGFIDYNNNLFSMSSNNTFTSDKNNGDNPVRTQSYIEFHPLVPEDNKIYNFNYLSARISGFDNIIFSGTAEDNSLPGTNTGNKILTLSNNPGKELTTAFNFLGEKAYIRMEMQMNGNNPNGYFRLKALHLYAKKAFSMRNL